MSPSTVKAKRLWAFLKPYWKLELLTFLVMVFLSGLVLALPIAVQYLIDDLIPNLSVAAVGGTDLQPIIVFACLLIGIYLAQVGFSWARDYLVGYLAAHIIADIRSVLFLHLETLSLKFFQKRQIGEIMARLLNDVNRIQELLTSTLLMFLNNVLLLIAILVYLLNVNWQLTLIAIVPVPLTIFFTSRIGGRLHDLSRRMQEANAAISAKVQETLSAIKVVKAFGKEQGERRSFDVVLSGLTHVLVRFSVVRSLSLNLVNFINMIGPIVVLSVGAYLVAIGTMKLGELIAFYVLLAYLYSPVQGLAYTRIEVSSAMASVDRIFEYLDIPPEVKEDPEPTVISRARGAIELREVAFGYDDNAFRLDNFNLQIHAKETLAIVGPSGSGKTTLISLIMRFFDPERGTITIDGVDLRKLSLTSLRDNIALVDQDPLLFNASIADNIAYSNPDADREQIIRAAKIANIHDFISSLPDGYNSGVGERGVTMSGGERQRICLARAILKDPPILILDEATSALDSISEQLIQDALDKILADKTAIIIAHRLSTVQRADRIIALKDGKIMDQGTHQELLEKSALYQELAQKQLKP
jgi:ABC-type multidrug transport system fused ATPase/permease subunit